MANEEIAQRLWDTLVKSQGIRRTHRVSSLWAGKVGQCERRSYYELTKTPIDDIETDDEATGINPISQFVMDFGNQFESLIIEKINYASRDGVGYWGKGYVDEPNLNITGETDPIVQFEGHTIILECKATHRDHFRTIFSKFKQGKIDEQYYNQIQTYLHLMPEADFGIIVVANRDMKYNEKGKDTEMPAVLLMPVERDMEWKKINWERVRKLNKSIESKTPPERPYAYSDWHCVYCPFRNTCWEGFGMDIPNGGESNTPT